MKKKRAVFLDLNGTLVLPLKPESLSEMKLIPDADTAVNRLISAGFICPVVTVQSRIAIGLFTIQEFRAWFCEFFNGFGLDLKGPYICPHRYNHPCSCQKPNSLLYEHAAQEFSIDLSQSYVIGDSPEDMKAACQFGSTGCLVRTGWAEDNGVIEKVGSSAAYIGRTVVDAVDWILKNESTN